jgi:hypothetical protein
MLRDFKRPDLHAPRFRSCALQLLNKRFYDRVRKEKKELAGLSDAAIKGIVRACSAVIQEQVVALRDGVELPEQLGYLFIGSTPATRNGNVDYKKSIELGKEVRHRNWDTDELTGKIFYTNYGTKYRFKSREVWKFVPVRQFKRVVAREYPKDFNKYVRVDNKVRVSVMFRKG